MIRAAAYLASDPVFRMNPPDATTESNAHTYRGRHFFRIPPAIGLLLGRSKVPQQ